MSSRRRCRCEQHGAAEAPKALRSCDGYGAGAGGARKPPAPAPDAGGLLPTCHAKAAAATPKQNHSVLRARTGGAQQRALAAWPVAVRASFASL